MAKADIVKMLNASEFIEVACLPNARRTYHVTGNSIYAINGFGECIQMHCTGDEITWAKAPARQHFQDEVQREQYHGSAFGNQYSGGGFDEHKPEHILHVDRGSYASDL